MDAGTASILIDESSFDYYYGAMPIEFTYGGAYFGLELKVTASMKSVTLCSIHIEVEKNLQFLNFEYSKLTCILKLFK